MMKKPYIALALLMVVGLAAGCAAKGAPVYGKDDHNITVKAGEQFVIQLDENPTTGYQWTVAISDESIVKLDKDDYQQQSAGSNIVGAGGTRVLTFKGLKQGTVTLTLTNERSFEKNSAVETLKYQITVN